MRQTLGGVDGSRLERSCSRPDSIRFGPATDGLQLAEAHFSSRAYEPHRHDTYGIGITTTGVQTFGYRGERHVCLPGQLHILHPDELHDGAAGTTEGFGYRILYIAPELIFQATGGGPLPFVADPVHDRTPATWSLASLLHQAEEPISDLSRVEIAAMVADVLGRLSGRTDSGRRALDRRAVEAVREYLVTHAMEQTRASTLEQISGLDRFAIVRQFRRAFGTSPDRYRTMRRLTLARAAIEEGIPLAAAAAEAGFADQSHMTRQFKRAFGLTPARWAQAVGVG